MNLRRTIESLLLAALLMPAGMLLATETYRPPTVTSSTANWYDTEQATNLFNQVQALALKTRKEVARLQVQEEELAWQVQSQRLMRAKNDINTMADDLARLNRMKDGLEPWQKSLVNKITPEVHEMVYQMDAAVAKLNNHKNRLYLALTEYPQNINMIYKSANQMAGTIDTVTQYAHAEEDMAALHQRAHNPVS